MFNHQSSECASEHHLRHLPVSISPAIAATSTISDLLLSTDPDDPSVWRSEKNQVPVEEADPERARRWRCMSDSLHSQRLHRGRQQRSISTDLEDGADALRCTLTA